MSRYLPVFHALDSLGLSYCSALLSTYLCTTNFQYCEAKTASCPAEIIKPSRQYCSYFLNASEPCSVSRLNNNLDNAGYDIQLSTTDFECSTLQETSDPDDSVIISAQGTEK